MAQELDKVAERLIADRKVRALALVGSYGTDLAWAGSVPTLLSFERGLLSAQSELRAGMRQERLPFEKLELWRDWDTAQAEAPLALLATGRVLYDPTGHFGRIQRMLLGLGPERLALYRQELLTQARTRLEGVRPPGASSAGARRGPGVGGGVPEQLTALVTAREAAVGLLYPALLSHLHQWPESEVRLPHMWRAVAGLRFPRSIYNLERLYAFGGQEEARRCLLATRGLGLVEQERRARAAYTAGYYDGAVRLLRDETASVHRADLQRWTSLTPARQAKLAQLVGLGTSPLGPTALTIAQELLEDVQEGR